MGLSIEDVEIYLDEVDSLGSIDNHAVSYHGDKTGQLPLAIEHSLQCLDSFIDKNKDGAENELLLDLSEQLEDIPTHFDLKKIYKALMQFDAIQNNLMQGVKQWLQHPKKENAHRLPFVKAIVLVLKIIHYDLHKSDGPLVKSQGWGIFKFEVTLLSKQQRIDNRGKITALIQNFQQEFEPQEPPIESLEGRKA